MGLESRRLRHLRAQVHDGGCGNGAEGEKEAPREVVIHASCQQGDGDDGPDDQPECLHRENEANQLAPVQAVGVLAHEDRRDGVVTTDSEAEKESGSNQPDESGCHGGEQGANDHQDGHDCVDPLTTQDVGEATEQQRPEEGSQDG